MLFLFCGVTHMFGVCNVGQVAGKGKREKKQT